MHDYHCKMKELVESLATAGAPVFDNDLIASTLAGLDMEYIPITTMLLRDAHLS
ncbi:hypothetical protein Sjap_005606 [Stephania japonica]|uniref:Uncharacterized protein n=1 Tax=Stephania japonica TaxID=461633 RepID=A0AAP0PI52_9MAGN